MRSVITSVACALFALQGASASVVKAPAVDPLQPIQITSPDGSARAELIPFGATATAFWVKDKHGKFRDVLLGYDNKTLYKTQEDGHPYFGPVVGRYANRIRNGTFTIPQSKDATGPGHKYHVVANEHDGLDTLHGGAIGYDAKPWTVIKRTAHSVSFRLYDPDGFQGFPGAVTTIATYTLENKATWKIGYYSTATKETPIMLSAHQYWNFEAYQETQDLNGHIMQLQASKYVDTDGILIPTGKLDSVKGTPLDFTKPKSVGKSIPDTAAGQFCGTDCVGFDNCWVYDKNTGKKPVFSIWSVNSGIKLDVTTNQAALQIYTCNGINNPALPIPRKKSQGGPSTIYDNHSCIVIEQEDIIDGINNPEFGRNQIYGPKRPYAWEATYAFSVLK